MPLETYRYAVCGGSNLVFDTVLYFVFFQFIFVKQNVDFGFFVMSAHIASLFFVFPITFISGFLLNRYVSFSDSDLPWKQQFFRYFLVGMGALAISYISMKFMVEELLFFPTPSRLLTIVIMVIYGYILQRHFTFKK